MVGQDGRGKRLPSPRWGGDGGGGRAGNQSFCGPLKHRAAAEGAGEEAGEVARLFVEMDGREDEFDRPFGGVAGGFQRIRQAKAADGEVGPQRGVAVKLQIDVLTF